MAFSSLVKFLGQEITSWQFEDLWPQDEFDVCFDEIYCVLERYYPENRDVLFDFREVDLRAKRVLFNILVFLKSECEFQWPRNPDIIDRVPILLSFPILKWVPLFKGNYKKKLDAFDESMREYAKCGELKYWPFIQKESFFKTLSHLENSDELFKRPRRWARECHGHSVE